MIIARLFVIGLSVTILCCTSEKKTMDPGQSGKVVARRVQAFEEGNLELVPYLLNFGNAKMDENYSEIFFRTMGESRLFFPDHVVSSDRTDSMATREMPVLAWQAEEARVDSFLFRMAHDPHFSLFRQECARGMLARTNLMQDSSQQSKATLWKYLKIMDEEGMYSPGLLWYALTFLRGSQSEPNLVNLADRMVDRHSAFAKKYIELTKQVDKSQSDLHTMMVADLSEASRQNDEYLKRLKNEYRD